jgi:hypothetical protein
MRPIIGRLIDDNYARQIRLPRDGRDFRTKELRDFGSNLEAKVATQRAWMADQATRAAGKVLYFGGQQRGGVAK